MKFLPIELRAFIIVVTVYIVPVSDKLFLSFPSISYLSSSQKFVCMSQDGLTWTYPDELLFFANIFQQLRFGSPTPFQVFLRHTWIASPNSLNFFLAPEIVDGLPWLGAAFSVKKFPQCHIVRAGIQLTFHKRFNNYCSFLHMAQNSSIGKTRSFRALHNSKTK